MEVKVKISCDPDIITIQQLAEILDVSPNSLYSLTNTDSKTKGESFLDVCYPFPVSDDKPRSGPKFIVKNKKFHKYFSKAQDRKPRPSKPRSRENNQPIIDFIRKMFRTHLDKNVDFGDIERDMAKEIDAIFSRREIESAFKNVRESVHQNNNYQLITLQFMLRTNEVARWSKI